MEEKLSFKIKASYALGQLGWSILSGIIQVWLVWFYFPPENVNITAYIPRGAVLGFLTIVGLITMAGRFMDAITDPLIAYISDTSKNPKGRRIPLMAKASIPFAVLTVLVYFSPVSSTSWVNVLFLTVTLLVYYVFITLYVTPYFALMSELSHNPKDSIDLSTYIALTWFLGYIIASSASFIWPIFINMGMPMVTAIRLTFVILAVIALIFLLIPVFVIDETKYVHSKPSTLKPLESIKTALSQKNFLIFEIFFLAYNIALTVFQTGNVYYVTVLLGFKESVVTLVTAGTGIFAFILYPAVNKLSKEHGKKKLCIIAMICLIIAYFYCSTFGKIPIPITVQPVIFVFIAGVGMAIFGILPNAIVADLAHEDMVKNNGVSKEAMFFGVHTFMTKLGQMIAMVIFSSLLLLGKDVGNDLGIRLTGIVAAVIGLAALIIFFKFKEVKEEQCLKM